MRSFETRDSTMRHFSSSWQTTEWDSGLEKLDASELWSRTGVAPATALLDLDPASLCQAVAGHPRVGRCRVARLHPDRLVFEIAERRPVAQDAAEKLGIDAAGERFPLRPGEGDGLPRVRGKSALVLPLVLAARARGLALDGVDAARPGELRMQPSGSDVVVRVSEDPERSLDAWQRVRASGLIESYGAREVDLRFSGDAVLRGLTRKKGGG